MSVNLGQVVARNWPLKLAAFFFAVMLYIVVAAQQPITQTFALQLAIELPPGRSVRQPPAGVAVVISGKGSELLKLRSFSRVIRKAVPDTFSSSLWRLRLQPSDVPLPKGTDVQVVDITPRDIDVLLDSVVKKDVRIAPRVTVEAESGFVLQGLTILPSMAHIVGPEKSVAAVDSVTTVATVISSVNGPFFRTVPVDTATLGVVRVAPREVRVSGEVAPLGERVFPAIPVATAASGFAGFVLSSERVAVRVSGPAPRVDALTRDSLRVVAHLIGSAGPSAYARLTVVAPAGITAHAVPDSVALKRKTRRG